MIARTVFKPSDGGYVAYKKANHAHAVKRPNCMFEWWREYNRVFAARRGTVVCGEVGRVLRFPQLSLLPL